VRFAFGRLGLIIEHKGIFTIPQILEKYNHFGTSHLLLVVLSKPYKFFKDLLKKKKNFLGLSGRTRPMPDVHLNPAYSL
jgi:hypothetical protein